MIHGNFFSANDWAAHHPHRKPPTTLSPPCFQRSYYTGFILLSKAGHAWEGATLGKICVSVWVFMHVYIRVDIHTCADCVHVSCVQRATTDICAVAKWFSWFTCCIFTGTSKASELIGLMTWNKQVLATGRSYTPPQYMWLFFLLKLGLGMNLEIRRKQCDGA